MHQASFKLSALSGLILALGLFISPTSFALNAQDLKTCETLIADLCTQQDLTFIRNGSSYDAKRACEHLKMKLDYAKDDLNSVADFINEVASKSSFSGRDYEVVLKDGTKLTAKTFLEKRLLDLGLVKD